MFDELEKEIKDKELILIGETHGIKEIPPMLFKFFSKVPGKFNLCLEIPYEFQDKITSYMKSGNEKFLDKINFTDGRNTYLDLIMRIYKLRKKIMIYCIEPPAKNQEEKEKGLYTSLCLVMLSKEKTFAVLGDIHASQKEVKIEGRKIIPAGPLLKTFFREKMLNVRIAEKDKKSEDKLFNKGFDKIIYLK